MKNIKAKKIILLILIFILASLLVLFYLKEDKITKINVVDEIEKYHYKLEDRDSNLFKSKYESLKVELNKDEIDFEKYAKIISELYIIDFYTLNNKINRSDIGGIEYLDENIQENFKIKASETLYKYINTLEENELPEVKSVVVSEIKEIEIDYNKEKKEAYEIKLKWDFKKDLGYDKEGIIIAIKNNDKIEIAEFLGGYNEEDN